MMTREKMEESIANLIPLDEGSVEEFEVLVAEVAAYADRRAARTLFGLLDDKLDLGGVNQNVSDQLGEFPDDILVTEFVAALPGVLKKAPRATRDVVRAIVASERKRALLVARVEGLDSSVAEAFRPVVERVASYARYADGGNEVLSKLPD